jgi:hypothetical protein
MLSLDPAGKKLCASVKRKREIQMSSQFTKKAMVHVSGAQTVASLCDGREGNDLKIIAQRLQATLNLTPEQIDDYYDAFQMFPLDSNQRISASSIQIFYENSDINLTQNDAMNALNAFLGTTRGNHHSLQGKSIDFELFVINLEKWMKKVTFDCILCSSSLSLAGNSSPRGPEDGLHDLR